MSTNTSMKDKRWDLLNGVKKGLEDLLLESNNPYISKYNDKLKLV